MKLQEYISNLYENINIKENLHINHEKIKKFLEENPFTEHIHNIENSKDYIDLRYYISEKLQKEDLLSFYKRVRTGYIILLANHENPILISYASTLKKIIEELLTLNIYTKLTEFLKGQNVQYYDEEKMAIDSLLGTEEKQYTLKTNEKEIDDFFKYDTMLMEAFEEKEKIKKEFYKQVNHSNIKSLIEMNQKRKEDTFHDPSYIFYNDIYEKIIKRQELSLRKGLKY